MNLRDVLVMEVPTGVLKAVVKSKGYESKLNSTEEMATAIAEQGGIFGNELATEFKFAGSTAVNLNIIMKGISPIWHNKDYFKRNLAAKFSPEIFTRGIRPQLEKKPKLIQAYELGDKLVLAFSFLGSPRRYFEDFQIVSRSLQMVEYVIIHFSPFAVEVRASSENNKVFRDTIIEIMGIELDQVVWEKATKLSELEANELANRLEAKLRAAKHKMTEGPYATKEVTANTQIDDLEADEQYKLEFNNQPMKKKTLTFDFTYSFGYQDVISYVITDEGLWIRSKAGEEVITHILEQIINIRYEGVNPQSDSEEEITSYLENELVAEAQLAPTDDDI